MSQTQALPQNPSPVSVITPPLVISQTPAQVQAQGVIVAILAAITVSHLFNDTMQSVFISMYPSLSHAYHLTLGEIGLIGLTYQLTASILQPVVGFVTDRRPMPYSLACGMGCTLIGLLLLSGSTTLPLLMASSALVGLGSSVFHPEASRVARMSSGGRHGLAQSVFQVGGNTGTAFGPLLVASVILPRGLSSVGWFSLIALTGMLVLIYVGRWYSQHRRPKPGAGPAKAVTATPLSAQQTGWAMAVLGILVFSKYVYLASLTNYYMFYLSDKFGVTNQHALYFFFAFLFSAAVGTILGGPIGDRYGRKLVIWFSILGVAPFTLALPYVDLYWTGILTCIIGLILSSAFSAILVFAQELVPGRVGMISGLFFGFAFGVAGIAAAALGKLAEMKGLPMVYWLVSFFPLIGIVTIFLPGLSQRAPVPVVAGAASGR